MSVNSILGMDTSPAAPTSASQGNGTLGLPDVVLKLIFEKLPLSEDMSTKLVCKKWNQIVFSLPDPTLSVFGPEAWEKFCNFKIEGEIPPLPKGIGVLTRSLRNHLAGKVYGPPCTAILIPKGLTLNKLIEFMGERVKINNTEYKVIWALIIGVLGERPIEETYWFLMTNDVIEGSRLKSDEDQKLWIEQKIGSEYQLPTILEAIACSVLHLMSSERYLFGRNPWTYTCCEGQVRGKSLVVGGLASDGLNIDYSSVSNLYGAAVRRKFGTT